MKKLPLLTMRCEKPDGVIELAISTCCCPPGKRHKGQHTNAGTSWWRIWYRNDLQGPWNQYHHHKCKVRELAVVHKTCEVFMEALENHELW